jgi:hypothetical protein
MKTDFVGPLVIAALIILVLIILFKTARVVPQRQAFMSSASVNSPKPSKPDFTFLSPLSRSSHIS